MARLKWKMEFVLDACESASEEVLAVLRRRGKAYGPDVLEEMREEYTVPALLGKAFRMWFQWKTNRVVHHDSLRDLVGFGLLTMAVLSLTAAEDRGEFLSHAITHEVAGDSSDPTKPHVP